MTINNIYDDKIKIQLIKKLDMFKIYKAKNI